MSLREKAKAHERRNGTRPALDLLIESLESEDRAEVFDLLKGEPLLPHSVVARTLNEAFADRLERPLTDERIRRWRATNGVA